MRISDWSSDVCSSDLVFGIRLIKRGRGRTGEIEDLVEFLSPHRCGQGIDDIGFDDVKAGDVLEFGKIIASPGTEIIETHDVHDIGDEAVAKMRTQNTDNAGNQGDQKSVHKVKVEAERGKPREGR